MQIGVQITFSTFKIVYSGKADVKISGKILTAYHSEDMEVVRICCDTAEIWNYNTNNKNWELFNAGQKLYTDGKITVEIYKEGHGMLNFRVKGLGFLLNNLNLESKEQYIH